MLITEEKGIWIIGKFSMQGLDDTTVTAEAAYSINFSEQKKFVLVCIIMGWIVIYLLTSLKHTNSKQKIPKWMQLHYV